MSSQIIFCTEVDFLTLVDSMLRDENGVSHQTYCKLYDLFIKRACFHLWEKISGYVEATDDRYYLEEDAPRLYELV